MPPIRVGQVYREKRDDGAISEGVVVGILEGDWVYLGNGWQGSVEKFLDTYELVGELAYYIK